MVFLYKKYPYKLIVSAHAEIRSKHNYAMQSSYPYLYSVIQYM